jgi:sulfatase maturation enzyme AslB (radical SAM superfamily)
MNWNTVPDDKKRRSRYGFYGRLKAEFPSQVIVDSTEICNLSCIHCAHQIFRKSKYFSGRSLSPDLNVKLVNEVKEYGQNITRYIRYSSSGEPLIDPHIYEMVDYAVRNSGVIVALTTNGTLMTEGRIERLLDTRVNVIDISIDAFRPETYAKIRVNGNLSVTRGNVLLLIKKVKQHRAHTKVVVSYIEQPKNIQETNDFKIFWEANGADYVVIRRIHSNSGAIVEIANSMRNKNRKKVRRPCLYPWERIVLNPRGYLSFCPADWTHGSTIVDYRTATVRDIWQGEFYQKLRKAHLNNSFIDHDFCGQCPDWIQTRWPREGRSYADMMEEFKDQK